jgi:hypothetical protein
MPRPNKEGFDHNIHEDVNIDRGSRRLHALVEPVEAQQLVTLVTAWTPAAGSEINKASLLVRLGYAAAGEDAPLSGDLAFYQ